MIKSGFRVRTENSQSSSYWYNILSNGYEFDLKWLWTGYLFDIVYMKWIDDTERIGSKKRKSTVKLILVQQYMFGSVMEMNFIYI